MARLAAIEKGEYYPTPLSVMGHIASYLVPTKGQRGVIRLFDPCAGEGLALEELAQAIVSRTNRPVQTWGVEISPDRAAEAAQRLDLVLEAPLEAVAWSPVRHGIASVLFLNPPYDQNGIGGRMELDFLKMGLSALVNGGVLVYVIPTTAVNYGMVQYLVQHFQDIRVFRFGDESGPAGFDAFKQIVVLGVKRRESLLQHDVYVPHHRDVVNDLLERCNERYSYQRGDRSVKQVLPTALPEGVFYDVPVARKAAKLRRYRYTGPELDDLVARAWPAIEAQMAGALLASDAELPQPLMPPKTGHIAQIVAAGLAGLIDLDDRVFKGRVVKTVVVTPDPDDESKEIARDRYTTNVVVVSPDGLEHLSAPSEVEAFLQEHIGVLKQYIADNFQPYGNTIMPEEDRILDTLSLDKQLPGVAKRGLLPKQREVAVAITRAIERYGVSHLVGEMGFGKTRTSLASVELMHSYPALVVCPPHLLAKWVRESLASVPGARAVIVESIGELEEVRARYEPGQKLIVVVSRSRIKLGPGWFSTSRMRYTLSKERDDRKQFRLRLQAYRELRTAYLAEPSDELRRQVRAARRDALQAARSYGVCPGCGAPLNEKTRHSRRPMHCTAEVSVWDHEEEVFVTRPCGAALFQFGGKFSRWPLADYIRKKTPGFFEALIADEVHQYKAKDSDQGWAFGLLVGAIPRVITLTGTFFGGPASSILWLLHRTQRSVRDDFGFGDEQRWVRQFGILETTFKVSEDEYGQHSGQRRRRVSTKEKPGISPGIVKYTLPTAIFASIKDLGVRLPEFREEFVTFEPTTAMERDLSRVWNFTWAEMKEWWPHYTSAWLQWNLARPNSCFRFEEIEGYAGKRTLECPPVVVEDELLPKEEWLVNMVKTELAAGRKTIVYLRQTGTRDIRQRLVDVLTRAGIPGVLVLKSSISPSKREKWLEDHPANVLITNPKLVETGLDLVQYSTGVFYEVEYSLYTLWQACRRIWRLGQTRPVKMFYLSYEETLEEKAYALIGQKIKAAQLLYGDEVASALVDDPGDASLVMALLQAIEGGDDLKVDRDDHFFSDSANVVVDSVVGSPTQPSLSVLEQWALEQGHS
ncbi:MAG: DUF6094 domain-containing protein [Anaerolineae bacterium]